MLVHLVSVQGLKCFGKAPFGEVEDHGKFQFYVGGCAIDTCDFWVYPMFFTKTIRYEKHRKNCLLYFGDPVPKIGECSSRLLQSAWNKFGYPQKSIRRDQTKCVDCECLRHSQFFTDFAPSKFRGHGMSWLISCQSVTIYMNSWYKSNYPTNRFPICLIVYSPCYQWSKPHSNPLWMKPSKTQCFMD